MRHTPATTLRPSPRRRQRGIGLVEVLVALLVFSIGVLGLAKLQLLSLSNTNTAYMRSQASLLAYGLLDRMRANPQSASSGKYDLSLAGALPGGTTVVNCDTNSCTPTQLATDDLSRWLSDVSTTLPQGKASVSTNTSAQPELVTVTIEWNAGRGTSGTTQLSVESAL